MEHRFRARMRGNDQQSAAFIAVPKFVMRAFNWGRYVHVIARINDRTEIAATVINVGWGPTFLVPRQACDAAGVALNDHVTIALRAAHESLRDFD